MIYEILKILDTTNLQELEKQRITTDLLRLFNVSNSIKIALLEQLEELSEHIPCEVYTQKWIEIKSSFYDC